jgi:hypothetical protein
MRSLLSTSRGPLPVDESPAADLVVRVGAKSEENCFGDGRLVTGYDSTNPKKIARDLAVTPSGRQYENNPVLSLLPVNYPEFSYVFRIVLKAPCGSASRS